MLQSVAYAALIRNGYSGWNGADQAVTEQDDVDRIRAVGVADGPALQASQARVAAAPRGPCRSRSRVVSGSSWSVWDKPKRDARELSGSR